MAISNNSKIVLKEKIQAINKDLLSIDLEIEKVAKQKAPYDQRIAQLQEQAAQLRATKQSISGDIK
jgi:uncharacterized protein (DUF3084 family)